MYRTMANTETSETFPVMMMRRRRRRRRPVRRIGSGGQNIRGVLGPDSDGC
jgi:hypothetical protein